MRARFAIVVLAGSATLGLPSPGRGQPARSAPARETPSRAQWYAKLNPSACLAELARRAIRVSKVEFARGVRIPVRLSGRLGGVLYRTDFPDDKRGSVPWEIFDCRLVLALSDFSKLLRAHDFVEARIFSAYRPPPARWPKGKEARRHPGALAVDIRELRRRSGEALVVARDFHGKLRAAPCGPRAQRPEPLTHAALELRALVCQAAEARIFHSILTPNYNLAHRDHLHLEVTSGVKWFILR